MKKFAEMRHNLLKRDICETGEKLLRNLSFLNLKIKSLEKIIIYARLNHNI